MTTNVDKTTSVSGSPRQTAIFYQNVTQGGTNGAMPGRRVGSPRHRDNRDEAKPTLGTPALQVKSGQEEQETASLHVPTSFIPSLYGVHRGKENLINSLKKELI